MLGGSSGFYGVLLGAVGAGRSWARCCCRAWASWTRTAWCCWRPWPARPMAALVFAPPQVAGRAAAGRAGHGLDHGAHHLQQRGAILPNWVRGRGLAVYLTVFRRDGGGSLGWGLVAREIGVPYALAASAAGLVWSRCCSTASAAGGRGRLQASNHWPEPLVRAGGARSRPGAGAGGVPHPSGRPPRLPGRHEAPVAGAPARWRLPGAWSSIRATRSVVEWFFVESWAEHLRQHHRVSHADARPSSRSAALSCRAGQARGASLPGLETLTPVPEPAARHEQLPVRRIESAHFRLPEALMIERRPSPAWAMPIAAGST